MALIWPSLHGTFSAAFQEGHRETLAEGWASIHCVLLWFLFFTVLLGNGATQSQNKFSLSKKDKLAKSIKKIIFSKKYFGMPAVEKTGSTQLPDICSLASAALPGLPWLPGGKNGTLQAAECAGNKSICAYRADAFLATRAILFKIFSTCARGSVIIKNEQPTQLALAQSEKKHFYI